MNFKAITLAPPSLAISIIIPVKDEQESIRPLAEEIDRAMSRMNDSWECLWVDDGSADRSREILEHLNRQNSHHQYVISACSCGQSAALALGFSLARGRIFVTLDGDGQNDPADIPRLLQLFHENAVDMVNGWRRKRQDNLIRRTSSAIANGFRNWMTQEQIRDVGCALRVFHRDCVRNILVFEGMHRFLPTLARINGFDRIVEIPVSHRPRGSGRTKYGIQNRLWVGLLDTFAIRWMKKRMVSSEVKHASYDNSQ